MEREKTAAANRKNIRVGTRFDSLIESACDFSSLAIHGIQTANNTFFVVKGYDYTTIEMNIKPNFEYRTSGVGA